MQKKIEDEFVKSLVFFLNNRTKTEKIILAFGTGFILSNIINKGRLL